MEYLAGESEVHMRNNSNLQSITVRLENEVQEWKSVCSDVEAPLWGEERDSIYSAVTACMLQTFPRLRTIFLKVRFNFVLRHGSTPSANPLILSSVS